MGTFIGITTVGISVLLPFKLGGSTQKVKDLLHLESFKSSTLLEGLTTQGSKQEVTKTVLLYKNGGEMEVCPYT